MNKTLISKLINSWLKGTSEVTITEAAQTIPTLGRGWLPRKGLKI